MNIEVSTLRVNLNFSGRWMAPTDEFCELTYEMIFCQAWNCHFLVIRWSRDVFTSWYCDILEWYSLISSRSHFSAVLWIHRAFQRRLKMVTYIVDHVVFTNGEFLLFGEGFTRASTFKSPPLGGVVPLRTFYNVPRGLHIILLFSTGACRCPTKVKVLSVSIDLCFGQCWTALMGLSSSPTTCSTLIVVLDLDACKVISCQTWDYRFVIIELIVHGSGKKWVREHTKAIGCCWIAIQ